MDALTGAVDIHEVTSMKKRDVQDFKKLLEGQLEQLLDEADNTVSGMTSQKENFPDTTDRAALETDRNFMLRIRDRESKLMRKIKKALHRIENDTFGVCEECGEEISSQRIKARPVTSYCIDCKTKEEAREHPIAKPHRGRSIESRDRNDISHKTEGRMDFSDKEIDIIDTIAMPVTLDKLEAEGISGGDKFISWAENLNGYQRRIDALFSIRCAEIAEEMALWVKDSLDKDEQ